jgi:hypothetical protein
MAYSLKNKKILFQSKKGTLYEDAKGQVYKSDGNRVKKINMVHLVVPIKRKKKKQIVVETTSAGI